MVLMPAPTKVSRVGPATKGERVISVTPENGKMETLLTGIVLIRLCFSCPELHRRETAELDLNPVWL